MGEKLVTCNVPDKIGAGLSFRLLLTATAYPAPEWSLQLFLRGPAVIDLTSTPDGSQHLISANAAATAQWSAGAYSFSLRAVRGGDAVEVDAGRLTVTPDIAAQVTGFDGRSQAQTALEAIEAVLAKRATIDQERYRINNRELYRMAVSDLLKLRAHYVEQVRRERAAGSGRNPFGVALRVRLK